MKPVRLQKFLSMAGFCSRRKGETYITRGKVKVNGQTVTELGTKIDPVVDRVEVNGQILQQQEERIYIVLNKPKGYITSCEQQGEPIVIDLLDIPQRVYPVGRLDKDSTGLLLLTNDGDLSQRLSHPRHHIEKTYLVKVRGCVTEQKLQNLRDGILLNDGKTSPAKVGNVRIGRSTSWFELTIGEGRNRQVRRMCEEIDLQVVRLKRIRMAFLELGNVATGRYRILSTQEVKSLKKLAQI